MPDAGLALSFFEALYGEAGPEGWITVHSPARDGRMRTDWARVTDLSTAADLVAHRAAEGDVWFGVALRRERLASGRGKARDCLVIPGLWLDVDIEGPNHKTPDPLPLDVDDAMDFLAEGPEPSLIVYSGGGLQPYWLFDRPQQPDLDILDSWHNTWATRAEERGWALDPVCDPARMMRVPGSSNWKTGEPVPVTYRQL